MLNLEHIRYGFGNDSTLSRMYWDDKYPRIVTKNGITLNRANNPFLMVPRCKTSVNIRFRTALIFR